MANSRELVECVSDALGVALTEVTGHMRHLREAGLVTVGGRGLAASRMEPEEAARLICSLLGSEMMKDGVATVQAIKSLKATFQGTRSPSRRGYGDDPRIYARIELLGTKPEEGAVAALAAVLRLFLRERELIRSLPPRFENPKLDVRFSVQFPHHFVSLTVAFCGIKEIWTFGQRGKPRMRQTRECDEAALREIAMCLETP